MTPKTFGQLGLVVAAIGALSACTSAPTYGTGTRADLQLLNDIGGIMDVTGGSTRTAAIEYQPRPDIVQPPTAAVLPAPQNRITAVDGTWPESPEQRRQRLRDEATANRDNPLYQSPIVNTGLGQVQTRQLTAEEQRQRFREGRRVQQGAYQGRRFLSDPPLEYKQPVATAPVGELGEPEKKKEARRLKEARKNTGFSLSRLWPWSS